MNDDFGTNRTAAVVLAGGRGSRMGGGVAKPLLRLGERSLIEWVLAAVPAEVAPVVVNANDPAAFAGFGHPVVPDTRAGFAGPLAGLEAGAAFLAAHAPAATQLLALPGDTPFLTAEILRRLMTGDPAGRVRVARHDGRLHPTVALWPAAALSGLAAFLDEPATHSVLRFLDRVGFEAVDVEGSDPFFNVNTPDDLASARLRLASD